MSERSLEEWARRSAHLKEIAIDIERQQGVDLPLMAVNKRLLAFGALWALDNGAAALDEIARLAINLAAAEQRAAAAEQALQVQRDDDALTFSALAELACQYPDDENLNGIIADAIARLAQRLLSPDQQSAWIAAQEAREDGVPPIT